jgi:hypothetical protein
MSHRFGLDRPLKAGVIYVPDQIATDGRHGIVWEYLHWDRVKERRPGAALLQNFIALANESDEKILAFAKYWGVLELCSHGMPACHDSCRPNRRGDRSYWESIDDWRLWAGRMRSILSIAARVQGGEVGEERDWRVVRTIGRLQESAMFDERGRSADRSKLTVVLNMLCTSSRLHPFVDFAQGRCSLDFLGGHTIGCGLFGAIVWRLILAATTSEGIAVCSSCGQPYFPKRRPNFERRWYCPACRDSGAPVRDAARDYRLRNRQKPPPEARGRRHRSS